jgi:hypothetical protein
MVKYTKKDIEKLVQQKELVKKYIDALSKFQSDKIEDYKQGVLTFIDNTIKAYQNRIDYVLSENIVDASDIVLANLKMYYGAVFVLKDLKEHINKSQDLLEEAKAKLSELSAKIDTAKENTIEEEE